MSQYMNFNRSILGQYSLTTTVYSLTTKIHLLIRSHRHAPVGCHVAHEWDAIGDALVTLDQPLQKVVVANQYDRSLTSLRPHVHADIYSLCE